MTLTDEDIEDLKKAGILPDSAMNADSKAEALMKEVSIYGEFHGTDREREPLRLVINDLKFLISMNIEDGTKLKDKRHSSK